MPPSPTRARGAASTPRCSPCSNSGCRASPATARCCSPTSPCGSTWRPSWRPNGWPARGCRTSSRRSRSSSSAAWPKATRSARRRRRRFVRIDAGQSRDQVWQQIEAAAGRARPRGVSMSAAALSPWLRKPLTELLRQRGHAWLLQGPSGLGQYELGLALARRLALRAARRSEGGGRLRPLPELPCDFRAHPCRSLRADARSGDAGTRLAAGREEPGGHRRQEAQAQPRDPRRGDARRGRLRPAHQRARARQGGAGVSGRAHEHDHGQRLAEDAGGAGRRRALRAGQRSRLATAAHHPQPLPRLHLALARRRRGARLAGGAGRARQRRAGPAARRRRPARATRCGLAPQASRPRPGACCPRPCCAATSPRWPTMRRPRPSARCRSCATTCMATGSGAAPRFFEPADLPAVPPKVVLARWSKSLANAAKTAEHPFNAGLMLEALVSEARSTLNSAGRRP